MAITESKEKKAKQSAYKQAIEEQRKTEIEKEKLKNKISTNNHTDNILNSLDILRNNKNL